MSNRQPPESAFREALEARTFWREAVLNDPELGFLIVDTDGMILSANDNAADILTGSTADMLVGRALADVLPEPIAHERAEFVGYVQDAQRTLAVTSIFRGMRCRCVLRRLSGDAGTAGHVLWTIRRAPVPYQPADLHAAIDSVDAKALDWGPLQPLSDDERTLLGLLASGISTEDAASQLNRPVDVICRMRRAIHEKLNEPCLMRLARLALAAGLVEFHSMAFTR